SVVLAIDEAALQQFGGMAGMRKPLADALRIVSNARPKAVAIDVILADRIADTAASDALARALCGVPNLVLDAELVENRWEMPLAEFLTCHPALGHVSAAPDGNDSITRAIPLQKVAGVTRLWALSLEAFARSRGVRDIVESPTDLQVGSNLVPIPLTQKPWWTSSGHDTGRFLRIRYLPPPATVPRVSLAGLLKQPQLAAPFRDSVVFVGLTATTLQHDQLFTPQEKSIPTPGIEIHAEAFETLAQGLFITDVADVWVFLFSLGLVAAVGLAFRYLPGWWAYAGGLALLAIAFITPYVFFTHRLVFSFATPVSVAWFTALAAAAYYHLVVRRNWRIEQASRTRYQQAMQFVTHEMRTPLSAIQGSSELISRYALNEEKRKQIALLINSESKRLARMVEVFLSVERLSAGQMELKREDIAVKPMVEICMERARPLAERKRIAITLEPIAEEVHLTGDRELMEYACYNLLTNAVKYSPRETEVTVTARKVDGHIRIAVKDQGIGMDQREVKQIFQKFYRTKKAEESGEAGTGIGLSIVQQIVEQHGGRIDVVSQPGLGSCFTLVMPSAVAPMPTVAERH
ncbi:MAG TPA: ATP-binding protein, partial [Candidatus Sulfopaludibacter sp.]|nr:ATP-binding protein [Candidatus Sulfopaludibacter sp.]